MLHVGNIQYRNEQGIFPIVIFERRTGNFKCIGTSFFINSHGVFVTAKHVIVDELGENKMMFIVQSLSNSEVVNRVVTEVCVHPFADIVIGLVGIARHPLTAEQVPFELVPSCRLSTKFLEKRTQLMGCGYPYTKKVVNANLTTFTLQGTWSEGIVEDFHQEGMSHLKNRCYQTTMHIQSGSSGGPVFKDGYVIGINSTSYDVIPEENPVSFVTPIDYLLVLQLTIGNELMSVAKMIERGLVIVEL